MSLPIKPICKANDSRRNGTSVIYFQYCFSAENRTLLNTGIAIPSQHWNKAKLCIKNSLPEVYGNYFGGNDNTCIARHSSKRELTTPT
jgi:hypothetical protein